MRRGEKVPAEPAKVEPRCAHCDLPAGRTPDGEDLGPLAPVEEHARRQAEAHFKRTGETASDSVPEEHRGKLSHAGCTHALRAFRPDGVKALAPGGFSRPEGGLTVHVFESHGYLPGKDEGEPMTARCGLVVPLSRRVEWTVTRNDAPNMCPGCATPRDSSARAFPALLPEGPRS